MRKSALLCIFLLFFSFFSYAKEAVPKGSDLCDNLFTLCTDCGMSPQKVNIISSLPNQFPYNISIDIPGNQEKMDNDSRNCLILVLAQAEVFEKPETLISILFRLSAHKYDFDIKILLSYDGFLTLGNRNVTQGAMAFLDTIENAQNYTAVFITLNHDSNEILPGAEGFASPTWLVQNTYKAFQENNLLSLRNFGYISFLYRQNLFKSPIFGQWLKSGIPSIRLFFNKTTNGETVSDTISCFLNNFKTSHFGVTDTHSFMLPFYRFQLWLDEGNITFIILVTVLFSLILMFSFGFFNRTLSRKAWSAIKHIWYFPFLFYGITLLIFFMYKSMVFLLREKLNIELSLFASISFIYPLIFVIISLVFLSTIRYSPDFKRKTLDFLTLITASVNLYLFTLLDISFFPIFAIEFILALLTVIFKKNYFHFIILILFELPFVPYLIQLFYNTDPFLLQKTLLNSYYVPLGIFLIIIPQYLTVFRILTGTSFYWYKKTKNPAMKDLGNIVMLAIFSVIFEAAIIFLIPEQFYKNIKEEKPEIITELPEKILSVTSETSDVFGDKIRTITIHSTKPLEYCDVKISGKDATPVLFSENDYFQENSTVSVFRIPFQPPENMEFRYGEGKTETTVFVSAIYEEDGKFYSDYITLLQDGNK